MNITKGFLILLFCLFALNCGRHNNPITSNGEVCEGGNGTISSSGRWQEFNTSNSCLPSNTIRCLEVDYKNNLWIGTDNGLVFFDGTKWVIYNTSNSKIPSNEIWSIACEEDTIWLGFSRNNGLAKFDGIKWTIYDSTNSPLGEIITLPGSGPMELYITDIKIDTKHNIWIGTNAEGLYKFDKSKWIRHYPSFETPISSPAIRTIDIDNIDIIWIGHAEPTGVDRFDGREWTNYTPTNSSLPGWYTIDIHADKMNIKWFATPFGLASFDDINWTVYDTTNSSIQDDIIYSISSDSKNNLWIGTFSGTLLTKNNSEWDAYFINDSPKPAIPYNTINYLEVDRFDNKWLGTQDNGLYLFNENGIKK